MKKWNNKKWLSLILAIFLVILISLLAISILDYVIPFSKNVKSIENSSVAYYQANSAIEKWLFKIYERNNSWTILNTTEFNESYSWVITNKYLTNSSWMILPPSWTNKISQWNPIQLDIWDWYLDHTNMSIKINFKLPDFYSSKTLSWSNSIINWQLSSSTNTLNASSWIIKANDIDWTDIDLSNSKWITLTWTTQTISEFYQDHCWTSSWCSLKLSVINRLETNNSPPITIPYLEWKITTNHAIPLRYSTIKADWKSYWYKKSLEVRVPQNTTNQAFDFTIFQ